MNREDIIKLAREAGLAHFYDSEGHCSGITDARLVTEGKEQNDDRLFEMLAPFAALAYAAGAAAEREACAKVCAKVCEEYETANDITAVWLNIVADAIRARSKT